MAASERGGSEQQSPDGWRVHRLDIRYDGSAFYGWSRQPDLPTIEGSLRAAFKTVLGIEPCLTVAGRTDAGVHAWRQVVSLRLPPETAPARIRGALNSLTPPELVVTGLEPAPPGFDARQDATARSYKYFLWTGETVNPFVSRWSWHIGTKPDLDLLAQAAASTEGQHDFTAFTPTETEHVYFKRTIDRCRLYRRGDLAWFHVTGKSFLRHMVRTVVGTLVAMARGKLTPEEFAGLLEGAERPEAGPTAPAGGLFLWRIMYGPRP